MRAADNGISAVIDPLGRMIWSLPLGSEGLLDAQLPRAIAPTLYARFGDGSRRAGGGGGAHRYFEANWCSDTVSQQHDERDQLLTERAFHMPPNHLSLQAAAHNNVVCASALFR